MTGKIFKVIFTPLAEAELREAWRHIAQHDLAAADRFFETVATRTGNLRHFPDRAAPRDNVRKGLRMLVQNGNLGLL